MHSVRVLIPLQSPVRGRPNYLRTHPSSDKSEVCVDFDGDWICVVFIHFVTKFSVKGDLFLSEFCSCWSCVLRMTGSSCGCRNDMLDVQLFIQQAELLAASDDVTNIAVVITPRTIAS